MLLVHSPHVDCETHVAMHASLCTSASYSDSLLCLPLCCMPTHRQDCCCISRMSANEGGGGGLRVGAGDKHVV